ncbi:MAG: serine protease [Oceanicaulis sp.]|uniref:DegQ family serine endoprotease n=1 Tax=Oceanicaulis sp. UBA2681 TaxID=1947007 RepID=UPI000C0B9A8E|nr:DegQ family serine endoprotease [Oceanicaulis sp. UBA2681]MAP48425.1 serine protease [Oceanicaulis sp.]HCR65790.1 serine protease [Oceanicaulis sp.]|tara:strand:- start:2681 stop:4069 length:1389 start_codon:yes stop_codon:yes gene_type:complete
MFRTLSLALAASAALIAPVTAQERAVPDTQAQVQLSFAPVVRQAAPAVVNVYSRRVIAQRTPFAGDPLFERFFGPQVREREVNSLGSGVIVDASGVIVTNNHVVQGAQDLRVVLSDRREFEAELLLADERTDLAVLKISTDEALPVLPYDDAGDSEVGDLVLAIGNPFGVGQTVTSGIVSALARTDVGISDYAFFIQTDAAVNPGNSGGALVDMDGQLIGVNTAIFSRSGGSNGIGFAIPSEMVRTVVEAALVDGEIIRPWLGARLQPVTQDLASSLGLDRPRGAIVADLWEGGAADRAGLEQGDVVIAVDGVEVNDEIGARFRFATRMIGDSAALTVLRDGRERVLNVDAEPAPGAVEGARMDISGENPLHGAELVQLSPAFNEENGIDPFMDGVLVSGVTRRSAAAYFGFRPGDRILSINEERIETLIDLNRVLRDLDGEKNWPMEIERQGERFSRTLSL